MNKNITGSIKFFNEKLNQASYIVVQSFYLSTKKLPVEIIKNKVNWHL